MAHWYLDDDGLLALWGKIKERSLPVKEITTAEYNVLTEDEKNRDVIYLIVDDNSNTPCTAETCKFDPGDTEMKADNVQNAIYELYDLIKDIQSAPHPSTIYGVEWDGSSSTVWKRTDGAEFFDDPDPFVNDGQHPGYSPFDSISPWKDMKIVERPNCGTMVKIPKFYYKLVQISNDGLKIQISMTRHEGFITSPAHMDRGDGRGERDVVYIGRYHCSDDYTSKTGALPKRPVTRAAGRNDVSALGDNIWLMDFATLFTIWLLYLVEFADWNSQEKIGYGGGNGRLENTGSTDNMGYHTGTMTQKRTEAGVGIQYRYIESLWSNLLTLCDGCYLSSDGIHFIPNPHEFSDNSGGLKFADIVDGMPTRFKVTNVYGITLFASAAAGGSASTYSCDAWVSRLMSNTAYLSGGAYVYYADRGLFFFHNTSATTNDTYSGARSIELI